MSSLRCPNCREIIRSAGEYCCNCGKPFPEITKNILKEAEKDRKREGYEKIFGLIIFSENTANKFIKIASIAGIFSGSVTLLISVFRNSAYLPSAILIFGLTLGIYKKSRLCAILLFSFFLIFRIQQWLSGVVIQGLPIQPGILSFAGGAIFIFIYFLGILGTSHPSIIKEYKKKVIQLDWDKEYTRDEIMKGTRFLLFALGMLHIVWPLTVKMYAWQGIIIVGLIYILGGILNFFWFRFFCIAFWIIDLFYTKIIEGPFEGYSIIYLFIGSFVIYKMWQYHTLFDKTFRDAKWKSKDEFPSTSNWKNEVNRWLSFLKRHNQLVRFKPRLNEDPKKRDETLAEISSAFFIDEICGFPIEDWEPEGLNNSKLEFSFKSKEGIKVFCEVKSPGWERDIIEEHGVHSSRKNQEKYINAEVRSIAPWESIRNSIKKAYPKFSNAQSSLLIINDDLFVSPIDIPNTIEVALFCSKGEGEHSGSYLEEDGYFLNKDYENLGGILFLQVKCHGEKIKYYSKLERNLNALKQCQIPASCETLSVKL